MLFTSTNLPPFQENSSGYVLPKPGASFSACMAPIHTWWPYPANWKMSKESMMEVHPGQWIVCKGERDSYLNLDFMEECLTQGISLPHENPMTKELHDQWLKRGCHVAVFKARKNAGAIALGVIAPEAVGHEYLTPEGPGKMSEGEVILQSPRSGRIWRITKENLIKRYSNDGQIFKGEMPIEFR